MNERPMTVAATETDDELLIRIQSGDEQAFRTSIAVDRRRFSGLLWQL